MIEGQVWRYFGVACQLRERSADVQATTKKRDRQVGEAQGALVIAQAQISGLEQQMSTLFRAISRLMVEGARPIRVAMARSDSSSASPREISSRSSAVSVPSRRRRGAGTYPPVARRTVNTDPGGEPVEAGWSCYAAGRVQLVLET